MANYASLKAAIQDVIKTNGNNEITGALLQQSLLAMINSLGGGFLYTGIATPTTNPGTPDQNIFYIASESGTYSNFGGLVLADGEIAILKYNGAWSKDSTGAASLENVNQLGQEVDEFRAEVFGGEFEKELIWSNGYIRKNDGGIASSTASKYTQPFTLKKGEKVTIGTANSNICIIGTTNAQSLEVGDFVTVLQMTDNTGNFETHTYTATEDIQLVLCVKWSDYSLAFENVDSLQNRVDGLDDYIERISEEIAEPVRGTDTDFMELDDEYNLFIPTDASIGFYINGTNGQLVANSSFVASDFVPVAPNALYYIQGGDVVLARYYAFYNSNKEYISGESSTAGWLTTLQTPDNAQYVRFSGLIAKYNNIIFSKNPLSPSEYKYTPKSNVVITPTDGTVTTPKIADGAVTEEKTIFFEHDDNSNFIDRSKLTPGYYIDANGVPRSTTSSNYFITDKVYLAEGETYYKGNLFVGYCAFYREDGTLVQGYGGTAPFLPNPFVVPQGAVYGRFTLNVAGADQTCWISKSNAMPIDYRIVIKRNLIPTGEEITPGNYSGRDICTFAKIMCIGDSLTEGVFNYLSGDSFSNNTTAALLGRPYSYPQYLKKLTGCDVTNLGKAGFTSQQWYDYYTTGAGASVDFSGYDCAIIQLGVNDVSATLDTVTKDALDNIISKIKTANAGIKIFLAGIINAKSYPAATEGESYYAKDQWLRNYYNTYYANDNQVFFVDHVAYGHLRTLGNAQYGGSYPVDNYNEGHLSAYGYWRLAQDYVNIIGYIMSHNEAQDFRKIQFIGTNYQCY